MAKRRPRHGQNAPARAYAVPVLVSLALLITGAMALQSYGATPLKLAVGAATIITITTWQVWRQKRRARLGGSRTPAEPPEYTSVEPPPTEDTPPL